MSSSFVSGVLIGAALIVGLQLGDTATDLVREPAIAYFTAPTTDPVGRLNQSLVDGGARLSFDPAHGYLESVLEALRVPVDSQILVYSKTSVQSVRINPRNPRAIYYNDAVAVGYIRGADYLELAVQDPRQGMVFYTLDQKPSDAPRLVRRDFCLQCHNTNATLGVPGMLVRSIVTSPTGTTLPQLGNYVVDQRTPIAERWGGYYVTGTHGSMRHLGNALVDREHPDAAADAAQNVTSLRGAFDVDAYPSPHSDIAALMVFDHQMHMMNVITRVGWEMRLAAARGRASETARELAPALVDELLFVDEAPLTAPIQGTSRFAARFAASVPHDRRGRSLRDLSLGGTGRLMRYPCSYMIYSEAFDALPAEARDAVYARLARVLSGDEADPRYARLTMADRRAIVEILRETKKDWRF